MAGSFLWRGGGTALDLAADWTEPSLGTGPAPAAPGTTDSATIDTATALDATGTLAVASLVLDGELGLAGAAAIAVGVAPAQAGSIAIAAAATLAGSGRLNAPVSVAGQLVARGGALALFAPASGSGTLAIADDATLFAAAPVSAGLTAAFQSTTGTLELFTTAAAFGATITGFAAGDAIDIADATITGAAWSNGTLTLAAAGGGDMALALPGSYGAAVFVAQPDSAGGSAVSLATPQPLPASAATLALTGLVTGSGTASVVQASGTVALAGSLDAGTLTTAGLFTVLPGAALTAGTVTLAGSLIAEGAVALGSAATAAGTLAIGGGATLAGGGRIDAAVRCNGVLTAQGGALGLFGDAAGSGTLAIGVGATLFAAGIVAAGLTIGFAADATLDLADPAAFAASLVGLVPGDAIDLGFTTLAAVPWAATLEAQISQANERLATASDGAGGTLVSIVPCFCAGTRIATPDGDVPVEQLCPGDAVRTGAGVERLCWVGRSTRDAAAAPELRPVRLAAGCLAPGVPARDLWLSPEHAVLLGGVLVRAVALLDRPGVARVPAGRITYHHLGLARHGLVLAEGAWAETFLPHETVIGFDAEAGTRPQPGPPCLPRVAALPPPPAAPAPRSGPLCGHLERIVRDGGLLRLEGWAFDRAVPERPVALEVRRDGTAVARVHANRWRADLDRAGLGDGRCGFALTLCGPAGGLRLARISDGCLLPHA